MRPKHCLAYHKAPSRCNATTTRMTGRVASHCRLHGALSAPSRRVSTALERLPFTNTALKKLPVDDSEEPGVSRTVPAVCFSRIRSLQPLVRPTLVALSQPALALLDLRAQDVWSVPAGPEYLSGSTPLPGSEPAAHCYSGHQFGLFAGQLGDGAVMYLGEVETGTHGRWEIQVKGAGVTPYSRYYLIFLLCVLDSYTFIISF